MTPDEALAREEIRYTMSIYNSEGDRGRIEALAAAFTEDGVLEFSGARHTGRPAIIQALSPTVAANRDRADDGMPSFLRHNLTTSRIELRSDTEADAWTYFNVITPIGLDHCGVYVDRFVRVADRWLIAHRRVKIDWRDPRSIMAT